jgi:hypothetical protein
VLLLNFVYTAEVIIIRKLYCYPEFESEEYEQRYSHLFSSTSTDDLCVIRCPDDRSVLSSNHKTPTRTRKQEFRRTDFGSRLLATEDEGEGAVRVRLQRTGLGEGEGDGCV